MPAGAGDAHPAYTGRKKDRTRAPRRRCRLERGERIGRRSSALAGNAAGKTREAQMNLKLVIAVIVAAIVFLMAPALAGQPPL